MKRRVAQGAGISSAGCVVAAFILGSTLARAAPPPVADPRIESCALGASPATGVERTILPGSLHRCSIRLDADTFAQVVVRRDNELGVTLVAPDGTRMTAAHSPHPMPVLLAFVADRDGDYVLEVAPKAGASSVHYTVAVDASRAATDDDRKRAAGEKMLSDAHVEWGAASAEQLDAARVKLEAAVEHWRALPEHWDRYHELYARTTIEIIRYLKTDYTACLEEDAALLSAWRQLGDRTGELVGLGTTGRTYLTMGELHTAIEWFQKQLDLARAESDLAFQAEALGNIGAASSYLGNYQAALDAYEAQRVCFVSLGDVRGVTRAHASTGSLYWQLGRPEKALPIALESVRLAREQNDAEFLPIGLIKVARIEESLGNFASAVRHLEEALHFLAGKHNPLAEGIALKYLGLIDFDQGRASEGLSWCQKSLDVLKGAHSEQNQVDCLAAMGDALASTGQRDKGRELLLESLRISDLYDLRSGRIGALKGLARLEREAGRLDEAQIYCERAVGVIEETRAELVSPALRTSYFGETHDVYALLVDVLSRRHELEPLRGLNRLAFEAAERGRARNLLEVVGDERTLMKGVPPPLLREREARRVEVASAVEDHVQALSSKRPSADVQAAAKKLEEAREAFEVIEARVREASPKYASIARTKPLTAAAIQERVLDADTVLLEYQLGKDQSYVWTVTTEALESQSLPKGTQIEAAARSLYALMTPSRSSSARPHPSGPIEAAATRLAEMVLPRGLAALGKKRVVVVPDGALGYVPFAMLPISRATGSAPLAMTFEIVTAPSASAIAPLRDLVSSRVRAPKLLAVFADPVFDPDDARLTGRRSSKWRPQEDLVRSAGEVGASLRLARLPFTRREATALLNLAPADSRLAALDFDASRRVLLSSELGGYRYLHFATHGFLNSVHPDLSGVVLSLTDREGRPEAGFVTAADVLALNLDADLVVLSGCQTAFGKEVKGEGLVGLVRAFMHAGAPRIVASLWKVDDAATAELMRLFYGGMLGPEKLQPAAALRRAQLAIASQPRWRSPYYWAAFVLQGEWR